MILRGLPVHDADTPAHFTIQSRDVRGADASNPQRCVVARACKRTLAIDEAIVHLSRVYIRPKDTQHWLRYELPVVLRTEVVTFDRGGRAFQIEDSYTLKPPRASHREGARANGGGVGSSTPKRRRPYHYTEGVRITAKDEY